MIIELTDAEIDEVSGGTDPVSFLANALSAAGTDAAIAGSLAAVGAFALGYGVGTVVYSVWSDWYYGSRRSKG